MKLGTGIYQAVVKNNVDPQKMGRLGVWIPEFGGDEDNPQNWFIVQAATPYAGTTPARKLKENGGTMDDSQQAYGFWAIPPDVDVPVLVCFINGDAARGFWFACLWQQNMNHMVPGLPVGKTTDTSLSEQGIEPPVVEYNKRSKENPSTPRRPTFEPLHNAMSQQGLYSDSVRGPSTAGARRESPSKVFGFNTPRQNAIFIDDDEANEMVRMRTRSGVQVLISETYGLVYINSRDGNSWVEISDKGVDIYSLGAVSFRSQGSMNLHSDGSLNIEADGNLNLRAGGNLTIASAHHANLAVNGNFIQQAGGKITSKAGGDILVDSSGNLRLGSSVDLTIKAGSNMYRTAPRIEDNGTAAPAPAAPTATVEAPQDLPDVTGGPPWDAATRKTIARRLPTHEPFEGHPGKKVAASPDLNQSRDIASAKDSEEVGDTSVVPPGGEAADVKDLTANELDWLACCIIDEAGNQVADGKAAVAQVIKNRMANRGKNSDGTIKGTVLAKDQFSGFYHDTVGGRYQRVCNDYSCAEKRGLAKIKKYRENTSRWNTAKEIGEKVMAGTYAGGSGYETLKANKRAVMYLNYEATVKLNPNGSWRGWATSNKRVAKIGDHTFFLA